MLLAATLVGDSGGDSTAWNQRLKSGKKEDLKSRKTDMLRNIGKESEESVESVLKKKCKGIVSK